MTKVMLTILKPLRMTWLASREVSMTNDDPHC